MLRNESRESLEKSQVLEKAQATMLVIIFNIFAV